MANRTLSQIAPSAPANSGDQIVGVKGGTTDALYSIAQILAFGPGSGGLVSSFNFRTGAVSLLPSDLPLFTPSSLGAVPASGGGTANFLRADGNWVTGVSAGPGSPAGSAGAIQFNAGGGSFGAFGNWNFSPSVSGTPGPGQLINFTNPAAVNDSNDLRAIQYNITYDLAAGNPQFTERNGVEINLTANYGQNTNGGLNTAKTTWQVLTANATYHAAGQKNVFTQNIASYGMGDTSLGQPNVMFAGGPGNGDEGQAWKLTSRLGQMPFGNFQPDGVLTLARDSITSVTRSSIAAGITVTQAITGSTNPQTVTVSATTGISINDWLIVNWELPTAAPQMEAVQVTGTGAGTITAVFQNSQLIGATLNAALVLGLNAGGPGMGCQRFVVNETKAAYTTGTVSSISGGGFVGSGTAWSVGMVGGSTNNVGAVCLAADSFTSSPFGAGTSGGLNTAALDSWYLISSSGLNATHLGILSFSSAGDTSYHGRGPGAGGYTIRQSARILRIGPTTTVPAGILVCEPSTSTWSVNDVVLCPVCPYPDVTGHQELQAIWTPGGAGGRQWFHVSNIGARAWGVGLQIDGTSSQGPQITGSNSDAPVAWISAVSVAECAIGIGISEVSDASIPVVPNNGTPFPTKSIAIQLSDGGLAGLGPGRIVWGGFSASMQYSQANLGLSITPTLEGRTFNFYHAGTGINPSANLPELEWQGRLRLAGLNNIEDPIMEFGIGGNTTNWVRILPFIESGFSGLVGQRFGLDFVSNDGSDPQINLLSIGQLSSGPVVGIPQGGTAVSNVTNQNSGNLNWFTSVWTGTVAALRFAQFVASPGSGINNAPVTLRLRFLDSRLAYSPSGPIDVWSVSETGIMFLGQNNIGNGSPILGINMDASTNPTAIRTVKWPDVAGDILVAATNTTGAGSAALGANSPAVTNTAPYTWLQMKSHDGSTVYVPAWK